MKTFLAYGKASMKFTDEKEVGAEEIEIYNHAVVIENGPHVHPFRAIIDGVSMRAATESALVNQILNRP